MRVPTRPIDLEAPGDGDAVCSCGWTGPRGEAFEHAATHRDENREALAAGMAAHAVAFRDGGMAATTGEDGGLVIGAFADPAAAGGDAG